MSVSATVDPDKAARVPGEQAERPDEIPARGWLQVAKRGWAEAKADQVPLLAAGVAFYAFLAIFPAIIAGVLLYGLVADPATIATQLDSITAIPDAARSLIKDQLTSVSSKPQSTGIGLVVAIALALWSASGGVSNLMSAINTAYDEEETRGFVKKRGLALLLTVGTIVVMVVMLALVAVVPAALNIVGADGVFRFVAQVVRYVVLVVIIAVALAILYRVAPDRDAPKMRWVSVGAGVATLLWLVASVGFSIYAGQGGYANNYGAVAGIVVLLFWLWITAYAILLGAEINAESEQQTIADTTKGAARPIGERNAVKADSVPDGSDAEPQTSSTSTHDHGQGASAALASPERGEKVTASTDGVTPSEKSDPPASSSDRSLGELVKFVSEDLSHLVRSEIKLAQVEVTEKAKGVGVGIGAFGAAGVLALFGLGLLLATAVLALSLVVAGWLAALIVTVVVFAGAGIAALVGKKKVSEAAPPVPTRAVESVKDDVQEIKETIKR